MNLWKTAALIILMTGCRPGATSQTQDSGTLAGGSPITLSPSQVAGAQALYGANCTNFANPMCDWIFKNVLSQAQTQSVAAAEAQVEPVSSNDQVDGAMARLYAISQEIDRLSVLEIDDDGDLREVDVWSQVDGLWRDLRRNVESHEFYFDRRFEKINEDIEKHLEDAARGFRKSYHEESAAINFKIRDLLVEGKPLYHLVLQSVGGNSQKFRNKIYHYATN